MIQREAMALNKQSDFHVQAKALVSGLWRLYLLNSDPGRLMEQMLALPQDVVMIGTGGHELYLNRDAFAAGMMADQAEGQDIDFEILDEWYEVQAVTPDVCVVYGTSWVREKAESPKEIHVEMNGRFTVVCRNTPHGVEICHVHHSMPYVDQNEDEYYPKTLSAMAEEALRKTHLLERRVEMDALTELYNRVSAERYISQAMEREPGLFLMIDLDDFKAVNDTVGHLAGDQAIQEFTRLLRAEMGSEAILGRMGGDEFAAWLRAETDREVEARFAAVAAGCRELSRKAGVSISCSAGIARSVPGGDGFAALYRRADEALYRAKAKEKRRAEWVR